MNRGIHINDRLVNGNETRANIMVVVNVTVYFTILGICEWRHRRILARCDPFVEVAASMSQEEFEHEVANGRKLVILDEYVLDVGDFAKYHIGGKFVL